MSQENVQVVITAFEAASKGDLATASKLFTEDHVCEMPFPAHLPFGRDARGPAETVERVQQLTGTFEKISLELKEIIAQGDSVVLIINEQLRARPTGKQFKNNSLLWAKVRDGKIYFSRFYASTFEISESLREDKAPQRPARPKKNAVKNALKAATTGKAREGKNKVKPAKKASKGARKSTARARR